MISFFYMKTKGASVGSNKSILIAWNFFKSGTEVETCSQS